MKVRNPYAAERGVIRFIDRFVKKQGKSPSYDKIAKAIHMTRGGVALTIKRLMNKGYLAHDAHHIRDVQLIGDLKTILKNHDKTFVFQHPSDEKRFREKMRERTPPTREKNRTPPPFKNIPAELSQPTKDLLTSNEIYHELHDPPFHNEGKHLLWGPQMKDLLSLHNISSGDDQDNAVAGETAFNGLLRAEFFKAIVHGDHAEVDAYLTDELELHHADINRQTLEMAFSFAVLGRNTFAASRILSCADEGNLHREDFDRIADKFEAREFYAPLACLAPKMRD